MKAIKVNTVIKPTWVEQKAKLKAKFPKLTDDDVNFDESWKSEMLRRLELKLAIPVAELQILMKAL
jgi:hypothetical protein